MYSELNNSNDCISEGTKPGKSTNDAKRSSKVFNEQPLLSKSGENHNSFGFNDDWFRISVANYLLITPNSIQQELMTNRQNGFSDSYYSPYANPIQQAAKRMRSNYLSQSIDERHQQYWNDSFENVSHYSSYANPIQQTAKRMRPNYVSQLIDKPLPRSREEAIMNWKRISSIFAAKLLSTQFPKTKEPVWNPLSEKYIKKTIHQMDQYEIQTPLETMYKALVSGYTKCKENDIEKSTIEDLAENVKEFLDLYDSFVRINTIEMISDNEKLSLDCLYVSINIVNLLMDHVPKSSEILSRFFNYLEYFQCQNQSNRIARRMKETILYCLCNYCHNTVQGERKCIWFYAKWIDTLERCFYYNQNSNKIKLSAAIVLCFSYYRCNAWKLDYQISNYLKNIQSTYIKKKTDEYLGIRGDLIGAALRDLPRAASYKYL